MKLLPVQLGQRSQRGFTLIELLVTIAIIGALSALLITNLVGARTRAGDTKKKGELQQLKSALRLYYNDTQNYPDGDGAINLAGVSSGEPFAVGSTVYMKTVPEDYFYYSSDPYDQFVLYTELSNLSDSEIQINYERCCNPLRTGCPATVSNEFVLCED